MPPHTPMYVYMCPTTIYMHNMPPHTPMYVCPTTICMPPHTTIYVCHTTIYMCPTTIYMPPHTPMYVCPQLVRAAGDAAVDMLLCTILLYMCGHILRAVAALLQLCCSCCMDMLLCTILPYMCVLILVCTIHYCIYVSSC